MDHDPQYIGQSRKHQPKGSQDRGFTVSGWWFWSNPSEKMWVRQLGWSNFQLTGKSGKNHVPKHILYRFTDDTWWFSNCEAVPEALHQLPYLSKASIVPQVEVPTVVEPVTKQPASEQVIVVWSKEPWTSNTSGLRGFMTIRSGYDSHSHGKPPL